MKKIRRILALAGVLALVSVLVVPMTVFAANPDTGAITVTGTVASTTWTISVPSAAALTISNPRVATSCTAFTVSAATNDNSMTTVKIDAIGTDSVAGGKLGRGDRGGTSNNEVITPALTGTSTLLGWTGSPSLAAGAGATGTAKTLTGPGTYEATDVVITQPIIVTPAPVPAAAYTAVITFTATFAP